MITSTMRSYFSKIRSLKIGWNDRQLDETDFYGLCRRFKITVVEMPLTTNGFYYCVKGKHFIAIDSKLDRIKKLLVMFHEFAHFLMHAPETNTIGRSYSFSEEAGRATLFVEARDSQTGALLGRAVDQRIIGDNGVFRRTAMSNRADLRDQVTDWANIGVRGFTELRSLSPIKP